MSLNILQDNLVKSTTRREFHEAITALQRRSLVETTSEGHFTLQNVIAEYLTDYLVEEIGREIYSGAINLFASHALVKMQAKEYVQESQKRLFLAPIAQKLRGTHLEKPPLIEHLWQLLVLLKAKSAWRNSYAAGNLLNLLAQLGCEPTGWDFSGLTIWQADLRQLSLPGVNLTQVNLKNSRFTENFDTVTAINFHPDDQQLFIGTAQGQIQGWDISRGEKQYELQAHTSWVFSLVFSLDGRLLASSSNDREVCIWDTANGRCLHRLEHPLWVQCITFTPDSRTLICTTDEEVWFWDMPSGKCTGKLTGQGQILSMSLHPNGHLLATGNREGHICLWQLDTGNYQVLSGHTDTVWSVAFHPNGHILATGSTHETFIWELTTLSCRLVLPIRGLHTTGTVFSRDGQFMAISANDHIVQLWRVADWQLVQQLPVYPRLAGPLAFNHRLLALGSESGIVQLWDYEQGKCVNELQGYTNRVNTLAFSPNGQQLASGGSDQLVRVWDVETGSPLTTFSGHLNRIWALAFHPKGCILASSGYDKTVHLWHLDGAACQDGTFDSDRTRGLAFSPDGYFLAVSHDKTIYLYDWQRKRVVQSLIGHTQWVWSLIFTPDGQKLISQCYYDQTVRIWQVATAECLFVCEHPTNIAAIALSPDARFVVSGGESEHLYFWEIVTGKLLHTTISDTYEITSLAYHPNGQMLASGSDEGLVRLYDVSSGVCYHIGGHTKRVNAVQFCPNGRYLASASDDGTIRLWEAYSGAPIKTLQAYKPYENLNITQTTGLTPSQKLSLMALGAVER